MLLLSKNLQSTRHYSANHSCKSQQQITATQRPRTEHATAKSKKRPAACKLFEGASRSTNFSVAQKSTALCMHAFRSISRMRIPSIKLHHDQFTKTGDFDEDLYQRPLSHFGGILTVAFCKLTVDRLFFPAHKIPSDFPRATEVPTTHYKY